jgi:hypothetical protein
MTSTPLGTTAPLRAGASLLLLGAVSAYVGWLTWSMATLPYSTWAPTIAAPLLFLVSLPLMHRIAVTGQQSPSFGLLTTALALKLGAAVVYVKVTDQVYGGVGDFTLYHEAGSQLAESYRTGTWNVHVDAVPGYGSVQVVTGVVYRFTGTSLVTGFLVFSWLAFWGLVMIALATRKALPAADLRRCYLLILLLPSTLYWSSALGKDSLMIFAIGICVTGVANVVSHRRSGLPLAVLGIAAAGMIRPHVALMLFVALVLTYLARRSRAHGLGPLGKLMGVSVLLLVGLVLVRYATDFLKIEDLSPREVDQALTTASTSSAGGEASITPPVGGTVARIPWAVVTVLFRPFPWEAHNAQAAVSALECAFLAILAWLSRSRLRGLPRLLRREPYLLFVVTYSALFIFAFSSFANLGTLARERVQLFPLLVVLLCLPEVARRGRRRPPLGPETAEPVQPSPRQRLPQSPAISSRGLQGC